MTIHSTTPLDTNQELQNIISFILKRWEGIDNDTLTNIITEAFEAGLSSAELWFDKTTFDDQWESIQKIRLNKKMWEKKSPDKAAKYLRLIEDDKDAIHSLGNHILMKSTIIEQFIMKDWNFIDQTNNITNNISNNYNIDLNKLKPIGWNKLLKNYDEYEHNGMNEYAKQQYSIDKEEFKCLISNAYYDFDFIALLSLPRIMYYEQEQGINTYTSLISAVFTQGLITKSHNNSVDILNDFNNILSEISKPKYYKQIYKTIDFEHLCDTTQFKTLLLLSNNKNHHDSSNPDSYKERNNREQNILNHLLTQKTKKPKKTKSIIF